MSLVRKLTAAVLGAAILSTVPLRAYAGQVVDTQHVKFAWEVNGAAGAFYSEQSYDFGGKHTPGSASWREGFANYGFSGAVNIGVGWMFAKATEVSSGTWGAGDAAGFSNGTERTSRPQDAYIGWESGSLFPSLGENGVKIAFGRQHIVIGSGFLFSNDTPTFGKGFANDIFYRGGAYYLGAMRSFARAATLSVGNAKSGWDGKVMLLHSHNLSQVRAKLGVATLDYRSWFGDAGLTLVKVMHTANPAINFHPFRNGMKVAALRFQGDAGVPGLFLGGEYAWEDQKRNTRQDGWYVEAGWQFRKVKWSPQIHYRFARFSDDFDPLFHGYTSFGTWFEGAVAGLLAGPFNSDTRVNGVLMTATPSATSSIGVQLWNFHTLDVAGTSNTSADEIDLYYSWSVDKHVTVMPQVSLYNPSVSAERGGTQIGSDTTSLFAGLNVFFSY